MEKDTTLTFRLPSALKEQLAALAAADHRQLGQMVRKILAEYVEAHDDTAATKRQRNARGTRPRKQPKRS